MPNLPLFSCAMLLMDTIVASAIIAHTFVFIVLDLVDYYIIQYKSKGGGHGRKVKEDGGAKLRNEGVGERDECV